MPSQNVHAFIIHGRFFKGLKMKSQLPVVSLFFSLILFFSVCAHASWQTQNFAGSTVHLYTPNYVPQISAPTEEQSELPLSLMINLHGCAQKSDILKDHGNWPSAADTFNTIVAIPSVPNGGVIAGCWDYYGLNHSESNRHNAFVIGLAKKLRDEYGVDSDRVYISGLSSGAGLSLVLGCMAPDIFSGLGLNAGPSVGTSSGEISRATISLEQVIQNCEKLSQGKSPFFKNQKASIIYGNNDFLVDPKYNKKNGEALAKIYGSDSQVSFDPSSFPGSNSQGIGLLYKVGNAQRVSVIENAGLGHNWPAGQGGSSRSFVNKNSLNYPYYLLKFLTQ